MSSCLANTVRLTTNADKQLLIAFVISCKIKIVMAQKQIKRSGSKYKYVCHYMVNDKEYWSIDIKGVCKKTYKTELEAAKAVDLIFIRQGKDPVNVLKRA